MTQPQNIQQSSSSVPSVATPKARHAPSEGSSVSLSSPHAGHRGGARTLQPRRVAVAEEGRPAELVLVGEATAIVAPHDDEHDPVAQLMRKA